MPSENKLFLVASVDSHDALTKLFDFVWPSAVALWNLQWQAKGFLDQLPGAKKEDLDARFVTGSGIRGANLSRLAKDQAWPELQQWFARLLLAEICALFEGWIEAALDELEIPEAIRRPKNKKPLDNLLQFNTEYDAAGNAVKGSEKAIKLLQGAKSVFFQNCILPSMLGNKKHALAKLDNLLICYRAFKEVRNNFTHHGGRANQQSEDAVKLYLNETISSLGVKEKPSIPGFVAGDNIQLSLRGVVGFGDIILRIIATYDYLFANSKYAEELLKRRWIKKNGRKITVKGPGAGRDAQLKKLIRGCNTPVPTNLPAVFAYLQAEGLVF